MQVYMNFSKNSDIIGAGPSTRAKPRAKAGLKLRKDLGIGKNPGLGEG